MTERSEPTATVEHLPSAVVIVNAQGAIHYANRALLNLLEVEQSQLLGTAIEMWLGHTREQLEKGGGVRKLPALIQLQTGDTKAALVSNFDPGGCEPDAMGLLIEEQSVAPQTHAFIAMLGHELRNPLAPIRHAAGMLAEDAGATERAREIIERQVGHLTRLVDDLLTFGHAGAGRLRIELGPMLLTEAIDAAVEANVRLVESLGHQCSVDVEQLAGFIVEGDAVRLTQAFAGLIVNAAKYTPAGGAIAIRGRVDEDRAVVEVIDTGCGIDDDLMGTLFDPFVQAAQSINRKEGGLGLGLSLARHIVGAHGGELTAFSRGRDQGATFSVGLPRSDATQVPKRENVRPAATRYVERVLVVDDNEDAAQMLALVLGARDIECDVVSDGESALEQMEKVAYALAIVDIGLPGLDGFEVARRATKLSSRPERLVALSGYGQRSDIEAARVAGFDRYCVKPISMEQLDAVLRRPRAGPP